MFLDLDMCTIMAIQATLTELTPPTQRPITPLASIRTDTAMDTLNIIIKQ